MRGLLDLYIFPVMGDTPTGAVTPEQVYDVLSPIWQTRAPTAKKVRGLLCGIFRVGGCEGLPRRRPHGSGAVSDSAGNVHVTGHHEALPYQLVGEALMFIRGSKSYESKRLALEFLVLTATRTSEVRGMRWQEVDLDSRTWTIPAERMKGRERAPGPSVVARHERG